MLMDYLPIQTKQIQQMIISSIDFHLSAGIWFTFLAKFPYGVDRLAISDIGVHSNNNYQVDKYVTIHFCSTEQGGKIFCQNINFCVIDNDLIYIHIFPKLFTKNFLKS